MRFLDVLQGRQSVDRLSRFLLRYPSFIEALFFADRNGCNLHKSRTNTRSSDIWISSLYQPWGFALAPANFGPLSNTLLVSNNVNNTGTINGFNAATRKFVATLTRHGMPIKIDQLWAIDFGGGVSNPNNACTAPANATPSANGLNCELFFTAGPHGNVVGTFGKIRFVGDGDADADDR